MAELIDKSALIDYMKSQWDLQDLYMPVHFEYLLDDMPTTTEAEIRANAIDEFAEKLGHKILFELDDCAEELDWIEEIAWQLKAGE